jgi:hypothetical protein
LRATEAKGTARANIRREDLGSAGPFGRPSRMTAFCALETFERRLEST